jgi:hypothetical protein
MKTLLPLAIGIVLSLFTTGWVEAQEVRYDLTGNYPNAAPLTSLTAPGGVGAASGCNDLAALSNDFDRRAAYQMVAL